MTNFTTHYNYSNEGTPAFPNWVVRQEAWDEEGYEVEHMNKVVAHYVTEQEAKEYIASVTK